MNTTKHSLTFLLVFILSVYLCYIWAYALDIPWMDDTDSFIDSYLIIQDSPSWKAKLIELATANNEHRMFVSKLVGYSLVLFTEKLNFRTLILLHNVLFLALLFAIYQLRKELTTLKPIHWLVFLLFLLTPQYHLTSNWSMGWQTISVLFFGFLTMFYLPSIKKEHTYLALLFAFITSFCHGNGPFIWFSSLFLLLLQQRWKLSIVWFFGAGITFYLYFLNHSIGRNNEALDYLKSNFTDGFKFFFVFIGSCGDLFRHLPTQERSIFPFLTGIILFLLFLLGAFFFIRKYRENTHSITRSHWTLLGFLLVLATNGVLVGFLRAYLGFEAIIVSNYRVYSAFILATLTLWLVSLLPQNATKFIRKPSYYALAMASIFYLASWHVYLPELRARKQFLQAHAYNQQFNGVGLGALNNSPFYSYLQEKIGEVIKRGVYSYPSYFPTDLQMRFLSAQPAPAISWNENDRKISSDVSNVDACYFIFYSDKQLYLIPTKQIYQPRFRFFTTPTQTYQAELLPTFFAKNRYQLGLLIEKDGQQTVLASQQKVHIDF